MATVLFVCLQNAGRSQMSEVLFERAAGGAHRALSAGRPADHVHPGKRYIDWELGGPCGQPIESVRIIRDEIARRTEQLAAGL